MNKSKSWAMTQQQERIKQDDKLDKINKQIMEEKDASMKASWSANLEAKSQAAAFRKALQSKNGELILTNKVLKEIRCVQLKLLYEEDRAQWEKEMMAKNGSVYYHERI